MKLQAVKSQFNEVPRDATRETCIKNLDMTNLPKNNQNVCFFEIIVSNCFFNSVT